MTPVYHVDLGADLPMEPPYEGAVAIYGLFDPRDEALRYIGRTNRPRVRLHSHHREGAHWRGYYGNWQRQLKAEGVCPIMRVLAWVPEDHWADAERAHIAFALEAGCRLTNNTDGGDGTEGTRMSPATRERMAQSARGKVKTEGHREALSRALTGKPKSPEHAAKSRTNTLGMRHSEETRAKMRAAHQKQWQDPEYRSKVIATTRARADDPAWRTKMAAINTERQRTPEARKQRSELSRAMWADPERRARILAAQAEKQRRKVSPAIAQLSLPF